MLLRVKSLRSVPNSRRWIAKVHAVSRERLGSQPLAVITMRVQIEPPDTPVSSALVTRLARDAALRFLDIA